MACETKIGSFRRRDNNKSSDQPSKKRRTSGRRRSARLKTLIDPKENSFVQFYDAETMKRKLMIETNCMFGNKEVVVDALVGMYANKRGITCTKPTQTDYGKWIGVTLDNKTAVFVPTNVLVC